MKHKFALAVVATLSLLCGTVANAAGNDLPITHGNKYTISRNGGGDIAYTVPFTANYEVTLSGSEGAGYSSGTGGYGYTLTTTVRLNKGQTVEIGAPDRPTYSTSGSTTMLPHGSDSVLKVDGTEVLRAGGGAPKVNNNIAPEGVLNLSLEGLSLPVHWHSGNGKSGPTHSNQFPTVYNETSVGGCYGLTGHTHNATRTCPRYHDHAYDKKEYRWCCMNENRGGNYVHPENCPCPGNCSTGADNWKRYALVSICDGALNSWGCGNLPLNTQTLTCGKQQGQILNINNSSYRPHTCSGDFSGQSLTNSGNGKCTIRLAERQGLAYSDVIVKAPSYKNTKCELILRDDTVVYYKRE